MKTTRRRTRVIDPLASVTAVRECIEDLRRRLPDVMPKKEKEIVALLRAAVHASRYPATDTKRGRPSRFRRQDLLRVASVCQAMLDERFHGSKGFSTFVDHYLRILAFPDDVRDALEGGQINLFEAEQLARVTGARLGTTSASARARRSRLLRTHIASGESGAQLRLRVSALVTASGYSLARDASDLRSADIAAAAVALEAELAEELPEVALDPSHLFFETLRSIAQALEEATDYDLSEPLQKRLFDAADEILLVLAELKKRQARA